VLAAIGVAGIAVIASGLIVLTWRGLFEARGFVELLQGSESAVNQVLLLRWRRSPVPGLQSSVPH